MTPRKKAEEAKPTKKAAKKPAKKAARKAATDTVAKSAKQKTARRSSAKKAKRKAAPAKSKKEVAVSAPEAVVTAEAATAPVEAASETTDATVVEMPSVDKMVAFFLGGQRYGLPIGVVQEIQQIVAFSEVPAQGGAVVGMVNLRGVVIPAVDVRVLMGLPDLEYTLETPMIIARNDSRLVALIVDEVEDVIELPPGCLQPAPAMHALGNKMMGVCRFDTDLVYLLDVERLLEPLDVLG